MRPLHLVAFFLAAWGSAGAFLLTFWGPFVSTENGYFASWAGMFSSVSVLAAASRRVSARLTSLHPYESLKGHNVRALLALIVWLISLPRGASLVIFVCASDLVNTAVKWAVQRPRPRWILPDDAGLLSPVGAWEVDLSFPSAHTQFFGGLAFCACAMWGGGWAAGPGAAPRAAWASLGPDADDAAPLLSLIHI